MDRQIIEAMLALLNETLALAIPMRDHLQKGLDEGLLDDKEWIDKLDEHATLQAHHSQFAIGDLPETVKDEMQRVYFPPEG